MVATDVGTGVRSGIIRVVIDAAVENLAASSEHDGAGMSTTASARPCARPLSTPSDRASRTLELLTLASQTTDERERAALRREVAELNVEVARSIARRYHGRGEPIEDLEQAACVGLMKAVNGFQTGHGDDFLTYAVPTISGEVKKHFRDRCWTIRPTRRIQELQARITAETAVLTQELCREPTIVELAAALGEETEAVEEALSSHDFYSTLSLDAPARSGEEGDESTLGAVVGRDEAGFRSAEARAMLDGALRRLAERDRRILRLRYIDDLTQREIAARIGVTQMQVSRLLTRITAQLRDEIRGPQAAGA
jgi:RNA polymerase sigma-B factor